LAAVAALVQAAVMLVLAATLLHTLEVLAAVQTVAAEVALAILLMVRLVTLTALAAQEVLAVAVVAAELNHHKQAAQAVLVVFLFTTKRKVTKWLIMQY
jgi:hypothetical protein